MRTRSFSNIWQHRRKAGMNDGTKEEIVRMGIEKLKIDLDIEVGDTIRIIGGVFEGQLGIVEAVNPEKQIAEWAAIREAQRKATQLDGVGMMVNIDIGMARLNTIIRFIAS